MSFYYYCNTFFVLLALFTEWRGKRESRVERKWRKKSFVHFVGSGRGVKVKVLHLLNEIGLAKTRLARELLQLICFVDSRLAQLFFFLFLFLFFSTPFSFLAFHIECWRKHINDPTKQTHSCNKISSSFSSFPPSILLLPSFLFIPFFSLSLGLQREFYL